MNAARRKDLGKAQQLIAEAIALVETARDDEQDYFDNLPESFQSSEKGERAENAVQSLEEVLQFLEDAVSSIDTASE